MPGLVYTIVDVAESCPNSADIGPAHPMMKFMHANKRNDETTPFGKLPLGIMIVSFSLLYSSLTLGLETSAPSYYTVG
jgi:hypothetical protein